MHAVFQIPESWISAGVTKTIGDIKINKKPLKWGGQIAQTFSVGLYARPLPAQPLKEVSCLKTLENPAKKASKLPPAQAQPVQMMYQTLWNAYYTTKIVNPVKIPMKLATNSVVVPVPVRQGDQGLKIVLICSTAVTGSKKSLPTVIVPNADIKVTVDTKAGIQNVNYAAPGNSYPSDFDLLTLTVNVGNNVAPGLYGIQVKNPGENMPEAVTGPGFLNVFPANNQAN